MLDKKAQKQGVLLLNLGTPDEPTTPAVRRYLREFLSDPRVIDIPAFFRNILLYLIILPFRSPKSAHAYRLVWTKEGSPLKVYAEQLVAKLQQRVSDSYIVKYAMRYQNPSIASVIKSFKIAGIDRIVIMPLFPQYSSAATGSSLERALSEIGSEWNVANLRIVPPFYDHPAFIRSVAYKVKQSIKEMQPDLLVMSYHGLPERHCSKSDTSGEHCFKVDNCCHKIVLANKYCYRAQCQQTSVALAKECGLAPEQWQMTFQSRLGRTPWIQPYTDVELENLAAKGIKKILVVCPSFVADCLETLEEIRIRAKEDFLKAGGEDLRLVPCVNADDHWVDNIQTILAEHAFL